MRLLLLILASALCQIALGQPAIPDTPAGRAFSDWLTAFNSADVARIEAFNKKYARGGDAAGTLQFHEQTGGFELLRIERSEPEHLVALMKEVATERGVIFDVQRTGNGLGDNLVMNLRPTDLPPQFAVPRLSLDDALSALRKRADQQVAADKFSGALLFARGDRVLLEQAWGNSNRESRTPVTVDTQFRIGSMNKMFTAVATLQLVEAGKLSLQGTVGQYLPTYPNREVAAKVTVRHLLTHTGGTGDIFGPEFDKHRLKLQNHADYVALYGNRAPEFAPGSQDRYSNYGYVLLGALIEAVTGQSYYDYVQQNIFAKAGMQSTASLPESVVVPKRATGYTRVDSAWQSNADSLPFRGMAAGGGYSTVGDLLRFARALESGKLLGPQLLKEATKPQDLAGGYGYGFWSQGEGPLRFYGHGGGAPGMNGDLKIYPASGYVLVGLSNLDPPAADSLVDYFAARMPVK